MAPRPSWKGYLKLSLVSCAVPFIRPPPHRSGSRSAPSIGPPATASSASSSTSETGDPVETSEQAKGYEVGKGEYILVEDEELKSIQIESNHAIDIERFVPRKRGRRTLSRQPLLPGPDRPCRRGGLRRHPRRHADQKMVGLARVVLFRRERVMMLEPRGKGLVGTTLRYANEVHAADAYFDEIPDTELPKRDAGAGPAHHRQDDRQVRAREVRGSLRACRDRADPHQAEGHAHQAAPTPPARPTSST